VFRDSPRRRCLQAIRFFACFGPPPHGRSYRHPGLPALTTGESLGLARWTGIWAFGGTGVAKGAKNGPFLEDAGFW